MWRIVPIHSPDVGFHSKQKEADGVVMEVNATAIRAGK
jgi:hypothetical protein